jgi:hypothetical protein
VVAIFVVLLTVDMAIREFGVRLPTLGGFGRYLPWLLYPGLVTLVLSRIGSGIIVTLVAMALPAFGLAVDIGEPIDAVAIGFPLAVMAGVLVGTWAGTYVMRRPGVDRAIAGFVLSGVAAVFTAGVVALPFLASPGFM